MANELRIVVKFDTGKAAQETKQFAEGSVGALEQSLKKARLALKDVITDTQEHTAALANFKKIQAQLNDALGRGFTAIKNTTGASANAAMTMQALNYTIRDSPYFFRDFSLGLLAIGNNLNPLIDGLIKMRIEAGGGGRALLFLQNHLVGITVGFSIFVSVIQAVTFALAKNKKEAEETALSVSSLAEKHKNLTEKIEAARIDSFSLKIEDMGAAYRGATEELEKLNEELENNIGLQLGLRSSFGQVQGGWIASIFGAGEEDIAKILEKKNILKEARTEIEITASTIAQITELFKGGKTQAIADRLAGMSDASKKVIDTAIKRIEEYADPDTGYLKRMGVAVIDVTKKEAEGLAKLVDSIVKPKKGKKEKELDISKYGIESLNEFEKQRNDILREYQQALKDIGETTATQLEKEKAINLALSDRNIRLQKLAIDREIEVAKEQEDYIKKAVANDKAIYDARIEVEHKLREYKMKAIDDEYERKRAAIEKIYQDELDKIDKLLEKLPSSERSATGELLRGEAGKARETGLRDVNKQKAIDELNASLKEQKESMKDIESIANTLENGMVNTFTAGKNAVDAFVGSILVAIAKMLMLKAVSTFIDFSIGAILPTGGKVPGMPSLEGGASLPGSLPGTSFELPRAPIPSLNIRGFSELSDRIEALTMTMAMKETNITPIIKIDGKKLTKEIVNVRQSQLSKANVNVLKG